MRHVLRGATLLAALGVAACTASGAETGAAATSDAPKTPQTPDARLVFFGGKDAYQQIIQHGNGGAQFIDDDSLRQQDDANKVPDRCRGAPPAHEVVFSFLPLLADAANMVISAVGTWVVGQVDSALQAEIKKYSASYSVAAKPQNFYALVDVTKPASFTCFRATKLVPKDKTDPKSEKIVGFDFIGRIDYAETAAAGGLPAFPSDVVTIKPIRLYIARVTALTAESTDKVAVDVKLGMDVASRDLNQVTLKKDAISQSLAAEVVHPSALDGAKPAPFYKVYQEKDAPGVTAYLPPWDLKAIGQTPQSNLATASVTVTETGNVGWLLKNVAALMDDKGNQSTITKDLIGAAEKDADKAINPGG